MCTLTDWGKWLVMLGVVFIPFGVAWWVSASDPAPRRRRRPAPKMTPSRTRKRVWR